MSNVRIEHAMAHAHYPSLPHSFQTAHPSASTTLSSQGLPLHQGSMTVGQQKQFLPGVTQPFVKDDSAPATPAPGLPWQDGTFIGQHSLYPAPPTIPFSDSVASPFPPSFGGPFSIARDSRPLRDGPSVTTVFESKDAGEDSAVSVGPCDESIRFVDKNAPLRRLTEVFNLVREKPRDDELPFCYSVECPRSQKAAYRVEKSSLSIKHSAELLEP
jgi:hypothetical protein